MRKLIIVVLFLLFGLFGLSGCELFQAPPAPSAPPEQPSTEKPAEPDPAQQEINRLLAEAQQLLADNKLTTPLDNNAYFRFLQVLAIDEDHADALQGLNDIVEKYLEWAIEEARHGSLTQATVFLRTARSIDEAHPNIAAVETLIRTQRQADRERHPISRERLAARSPELAAELTALGRTVAERHARVTIIAEDDEDGRWIYQQMNAAAEERVRARLEFGTPEVRLMY